MQYCSSKFQIVLTQSLPCFAIVRRGKYLQYVCIVKILPLNFGALEKNSLTYWQCLNLHVDEKRKIYKAMKIERDFIRNFFNISGKISHSGM